MFGMFDTDMFDTSMFDTDMFDTDMFNNAICPEYKSILESEKS